MWGSDLHRALNEIQYLDGGTIMGKFFQVLNALAKFGKGIVDWCWANKGKILDWINAGQAVDWIVQKIKDILGLK